MLGSDARDLLNTVYYEGSKLIVGDSAQDRHRGIAQLLTIEALSAHKLPPGDVQGGARLLGYESRREANTLTGYPAREIW